MTTQIVCDGCKNVLSASRHQVAISGERADGWCGGELPDEGFHWCRPCALVAFRALEQDPPAEGER